MEEHYEKEVNRQIDIVRGIDCVHFSIGANNREDFAWIAHNMDLFKEKSVGIYNKILSSIIKKRRLKLYFFVYEEKESGFTATERRLGIKHSFHPLFERDRDVCLSNTIRYNYIELSGLNVGLIPVLPRGILLFSEDGSEISERLEGCTETKDIFDRFYAKGHFIAEFEDFWSEGNSLTFYAADRHFLDELTCFAGEEGFV